MAVTALARHRALPLQDASPVAATDWVTERLKLGGRSSLGADEAHKARTPALGRAVRSECGEALVVAHDLARQNLDQHLSASNSQM